MDDLPPPPPYSPRDPLTPTSDDSRQEHLLNSSTEASIRGGYFAGVDEAQEQSLSSAASYFESRPYPHWFSDTPIKIELGLGPHTTRDEVPIPSYVHDWEFRDVTNQDWATFVNYLLSELEPSIQSKTFGARTPKSIEESGIRRQKTEAVISEWNEGFFYPRGLLVVPKFGNEVSPRTPSPSPTYRTNPENQSIRHFNSENDVDHLRSITRRPVPDLRAPTHPFPIIAPPVMPPTTHTHLGRLPQMPPAHSMQQPFIPQLPGSSILESQSYSHRRHRAHHHHNEESHRRGGRFGRGRSRDYSHHGAIQQPSVPTSPVSNRSSCSNIRSGNTGNESHGRHNKGKFSGHRSSSTSSSASSSSSASHSSIGSHGHHATDMNGINKSLGDIHLRNTNNFPIQELVNQILENMRSQRNLNPKELRQHSRATKKELHAQKKLLKKEIKALLREAKDRHRHEKGRCNAGNSKRSGRARHGDCSRREVDPTNETRSLDQGLETGVVTNEALITNRHGSKDQSNSPRSSDAQRACQLDLDRRSATIHDGAPGSEGLSFGKSMEIWGERFGKDMEAWGEKFGKEAETWGQKFGRDMEAWGRRMGG